MQSSLIRKIAKANRYARERDRIQVKDLSVSFRGENDVHAVSLTDGKWSCTCDFFSGYGYCSHTMALEQVFDGMVPKSVPEAMVASVLASA